MFPLTTTLSAVLPVAERPAMTATLDDTPTDVTRLRLREGDDGYSDAAPAAGGRLTLAWAGERLVPVASVQWMPSRWGIGVWDAGLHDEVYRVSATTVAGGLRWTVGRLQLTGEVGSERMLYNAGYVVPPIEEWYDHPDYAYFTHDGGYEERTVMWGTVARLSAELRVVLSDRVTLLPGGHLSGTWSVDSGGLRTTSDQVTDYMIWPLEIDYSPTRLHGGAMVGLEVAW